MNTDLAIEYIRKKMKALGYQDYYHLEYRQLNLRPLKTIMIDVQDQFVLFVDGLSTLLRIESESGIYDQSDIGINELTHIHRGQIKITNSSTVYKFLGMIQVMPISNNLQPISITMT
jgi:hypothetical protein